MFTSTISDICHAANWRCNFKGQLISGSQSSNLQHKSDAFLDLTYAEDHFQNHCVKMVALSVQMDSCMLKIPDHEQAHKSRGWI